MAGIFSEPSYVHPHPSTAILSETRPTQLAPTALAALNYLLDELLHIVVHAALHSPPASTTPTHSPPPPGGSASPPPSSHVPSSSASLPTPLAPSEVLTTDRLKSSLARILGPTSLAKECILEAELAVRELIRRGSPSLRGDAALKRSGMWGTPVLPASSSSGGGGPVEGKEGEGEKGEKEREEQRREVGRQANEVFRALRAWVMQISGLGAACYGPSPAPLTDHLVALSPPKPPPSDASSPHLTFILALYVERLLSTLSLHLLRLCASVSARQSASDLATVSDLEVALMEDDLVWSWAQGMRVRRFVEEEGRREREAAKKGSPVLGSEGGRSGLSRAGSLNAGAGGGGGRNGSLSGASAGHRKGSASLAVPSSLASVAPSSPPLSTTTTAAAAAAAATHTHSRKPSLSGSTLAGSVAAAASSLGRRASVESSRSGLTYGGGGGGSVAGGGRKASLGLGIAGAAGGAGGLDDDAFDQLLSSNKTIKLSSTPDRLRIFEQRDTRKRLPSSMSMPTIPTSSSTTSLHSSSGSITPGASGGLGGMVKSASARRLKARDPQHRDLLEEEEEGVEQDDDSILRGNAQQKRKESLMDLLNSPPPWAVAGDAPPVPSSPATTAASPTQRSSLRPGGRPIDPSDPMHHPMSVAMRVQDSQASTATVDSLASGASGVSGVSEATSGGEEARVITSPGARMRALKAKDERRDVASERQVNNDLMDFFASTPPTAPSPENPFLEVLAPPLSPKRSKGGLRGLMSKVTGGGGASKRDDDSLLSMSSRAETPVSPRSGYSLPGGSAAARRASARSQSISGASIATSSSSVAAMTASGFAVPAARAAYNPPPGLGSPTQPPPPPPHQRERRSNSISSSSSRTRQRQQSLSSLQQQPPLPASAYLPAGQSDLPPPPGILIKPKQPPSSSSANASTASLPPPVPVPSTPATTAGSETPTPSIKAPKRSSSLKRNPREPELSAASAASAASTATADSARSSATSSPVPLPPVAAAHTTRSPRERESSAHSAFTTASSGSRSLPPSAETSAPPIVVVPNGLVGGDLASKSSAETLGAGSSSLGHAASREASAEEAPVPAEALREVVEEPVVEVEEAKEVPTLAQLGPPIELDEKPAKEEEKAVGVSSDSLPLAPSGEAEAAAQSDALSPSPSLQPEPSSPLPPAALVRAGSTTPLHTPPTPPHPPTAASTTNGHRASARFSTPSPARSGSPPLPTARVARFSAPSSPSSAAASLRSLSRSPNPHHQPLSPSLSNGAGAAGGKRASSPLASPPLAVSSPGSGSLTPTDGSGAKSLSTTLKELRAAMLYAETRDECVELVEALLRDHARRAEARAEREGRREAERAKVEEGAKEKEEVVGGESRDEEARLAEFFLSGGDMVAASPSQPEQDDTGAAVTLPNGHANDAAADKPSTLAPTLADSILPPARASVLIPTPEMRIPGGFESTTPQPEPEAEQEASLLPPSSSSSTGVEA
ncbi:hypothetical protein JCM6882_008231 [Rhodosporidiobolus microsporus]